MNRNLSNYSSGIFPAALLSLILASGCAATAPGAPPRLLAETTREGRGWPYGESGRGPVRHLEETSINSRYGWTSRKAIRLGGFDAQGLEEGRVERQIRLLNSLWGPGGEMVFYERVGTCCPYQVFGAPLDKGMLDVYALTWDGQLEPVHLYLDGYRVGPVKIPRGLTTRVKPPGHPGANP